MRISYFAQHHVDQLDLNLSPVSFLASRMPGKSDQEYRQHLGSFGLTGLTGLQQISTLSGGQKSRVAFALLSLQQPHILVLDEPTNHLDIEGLDALMDALAKWNGGVIVVSHDSRFIHTVCKELWVVANQKAEKLSVILPVLSLVTILVVCLNQSKADLASISLSLLSAMAM